MLDWQSGVVSFCNQSNSSISTCKAGFRRTCLLKLKRLAKKNSDYFIGQKENSLLIIGQVVVDKLNYQNRMLHSTCYLSHLGWKLS